MRGDQEVSAYNVGGVRAFTFRRSPDTPWEELMEEIANANNAPVGRVRKVSEDIVHILGTGIVCLQVCGIGGTR